MVIVARRLSQGFDFLGILFVAAMGCSLHNYIACADRRTRDTTLRSETIRLAPV